MASTITAELTLPLATYTPEEEKKARRAANFRLLPFIMLLFVFLQFDRTNLGNALTGTFKTHLKLNQNQINTGATLFTLGIVILELPSNIVSKRIGVNRMIPFLMLCWGAVTLSQAFLTGYKTFYLTRFLLAAFEAGFIPGMTLFISRFFTNNELGLRYSLFWSANNIAGILSGLIALGLLSLNGKSGLSGYAWLFVIEGALTMFFAIAAFFLLPFTPSDRRTAILPVLIDSRQAEIIAARTIKDDPTKALPHAMFVSLRDILDTFKDWQIYGHLISAFLSSVMLTPMNTYAPSLVKSLGFAGYSANALQAPGSALALCVSLFLGWSSDRRRERGFHVAAAMILSGVGCLWLALPKHGVAKGILYAGVVLTQGGMGTGQGINAAWMVGRLEDRKRPVALAAYVMMIQMSGFAGANVFKAKDAPRYSHGLIICGACVLSAAAVAIAWKFLYAYVDSGKPAADDVASVVSYEGSTEEKSSKIDV